MSGGCCLAAGTGAALELYRVVQLITSDLDPGALLASLSFDFTQAVYFLSTVCNLFVG